MKVYGRNLIFDMRNLLSSGRKEMDHIWLWIPLPNEREKELESYVFGQSLNTGSMEFEILKGRIVLVNKK